MFNSIVRFLLLAYRISLKGMLIFGYVDHTNSKKTLYQDPGNVTACGPSDFGHEGTSICDDVLVIPIDSTKLYRIVRIATPDQLILCEVEVFGGKQYLTRLRNGCG